MTVEETLSFVAPFYPRWDRELAASLVRRLGLPEKSRISTLSRGMKGKVALTLALGCRPELLILDDPTSGLDTLVRREFLEEVISNVQAQGGTVFFSSHLLHEVERVVDEVAIIHEGRLVLHGSLEHLKKDFKKLRAIYPGTVPKSFDLPGLVRIERGQHEALITVSSFSPELVNGLRRQGAESVHLMDLALEEIFVDVVKGAEIHV